MMQKVWSLVRRVHPACAGCALAVLLSVGAVLTPLPASAQDSPADPPASAPAPAPEYEPPAPQYDPREAGHPLRIAAYILHPAGVIVDYLILRPAYYVGRIEPFRTLFGVTNP